MYSNGVVGKKQANYSDYRNQRDYGMLVEAIGHPPLAKLPIHKILLRQTIMPSVISGRKKGDFLLKKHKSKEPTNFVDFEKAKTRQN